MRVEWYPGHMTKTMRMLQEDIKLVDLVIELVDARIPVSGRNPELEKLGAGKARMLLLGKSDLSDPLENERWMEYYKKNGQVATLMDLRKNHELSAVREAIKKACAEKKERDRKRGIQNRPVRAMVVGIPNVGKSTFINSYAGRASAKTGDKPGITRGKQWIRMGKELELLDTPGVLWPKIGDETVGLRLAMAGAVNDEILPQEELACEILKFMCDRYSGRVSERYHVEEAEDAIGLLSQIGAKAGCLKKGGETDTERMAGRIVDDFRAGRLGKVTLDRLNEEA